MSMGRAGGPGLGASPRRTSAGGAVLHRAAWPSAQHQEGESWAEGPRLGGSPGNPVTQPSALTSADFLTLLLLLGHLRWSVLADQLQTQGCYRCTSGSFQDGPAGQGLLRALS